MGALAIDDLNALCTKSTADDGVWTPLELGGRETDIEMLVYGDDSEAVAQYKRMMYRKANKRLRTGKGGTIRLDDDALDDLDEAEPVLVRFGGIRKKGGAALTMDGEPFPVLKDKDNESLYRRLVEGSPAIGEFIIAYASERSNFFPKPSKG